jgi:hypothetical protein
MTATELARRLAVDISVDSTNWLPVFGKNDVQPNVTPTKQESTTYETKGWKGFTITLQEWSIVLKLNRQSNSGVLDTTQQLLVARIAQFGDNAHIWIRWYDSLGRTTDQAWKGWAIVEMSNSKTGVPDLDEDTFTFTGDGVLTPMTAAEITAAVTAAAPLIVSATPSGASVGQQVIISGSGFTSTVATTGVKFGATNATSWTVLSDNTLIAVMPAGAAGAANIAVTNSVGTSAAFAYTRGA